MTVSSSWARLLWPSCISAGAVAAQTKKLVGVVVAVALAGVLIGFYISGYLVGNTDPYTPPAQAGAARSVNLTLQTVAAVGPTEAPNHPDWVSYLVRDHEGRLEAHHGLRPAGQLARARDDLQLRRRERPAQPLPRPPPGSRRAGARRRQAARRHAARPAVAHLRRPGARRARSDRSGAGRREEPVRLRAVRPVDGAPHDDVHLPDRQARATTGGSASSPAPPASSTASAGRCRRSGTWTAS